MENTRSASIDLSPDHVVQPCSQATDWYYVSVDHNNGLQGTRSYSPYIYQDSASDWEVSVVPSISVLLGDSGGQTGDAF